MICALILSCSCPLLAFDAEMEVAYETRQGFSDWYTVNVSFASGQELNRKLRRIDFDFIANYAMIWFDRDNVAILKLDSPFSFGGREFEERNWRAIFSTYMDVDAIHVNGERPTLWKLRRPLVRSR